MISVRHTADLPDRGEVRRLLDAAFPADSDDGAGDVGSRFSDDDFDHALGGMHVLVHAGAELVAHGSVVRRQFLVGSRPLAVGYVEAVAVAVAHRRRGHGAQVMAQLERLVVAGHGVGFLSASAAGAALYESRGWVVWRGPTSVLSPTGRVATPEEDGGVRVFDPAGVLDPSADVACDWRAGDVW